SCAPSRTSRRARQAVDGRGGSLHSPGLVPAVAIEAAVAVETAVAAVAPVAALRFPPDAAQFALALHARPVGNLRRAGLRVRRGGSGDGGGTGGEDAEDDSGHGLPPC